MNRPAEDAGGNAGGAPSDSELCRRTLRGGEEGRAAFALLVERHQPAVCRFAARYLPDPAAVEDVVQETFLRAWHQIARFRPDTRFLAWILTIARFLCMARIKEARRHPPPAPLENGSDPPAPPAGPPREALDQVRKAYASLPPHQREIVALRLFDGLSYREIARLTGEREVTLRSRLHDALARLQSLCGKLLP